MSRDRFFNKGKGEGEGKSGKVSTDATGGCFNCGGAHYARDCTTNREGQRQGNTKGKGKGTSMQKADSDTWIEMQWKVCRQRELADSQWRELGTRSRSLKDYDRQCQACDVWNARETIRVRTLRRPGMNQVQLRHGRSYDSSIWGTCGGLFSNILFLAIFHNPLCTMKPPTSNSPAVLYSFLVTLFFAVQFSILSHPQQGPSPLACPLFLACIDSSMLVPFFVAHDKYTSCTRLCVWNRIRQAARHSTPVS